MAFFVNLDNHRKDIDEETTWRRDQGETLDHVERNVRIRGALLNLNQRRKFANWFFWLAAIWLGFVALAIFLNALGVCWFYLEKEVAIALLASGIANVFAPVVVTAKGIFNNSNGPLP